VSDLRHLAGAAVLSVGDVMLDEYLWGDVRRISPEAPVPVVEIRGRTHAAGGAANVAAGVIALSGRAHLAGVVGADASAEALREALNSAGVAALDLVVDAARPTTSKTRIIAHAQQVVRADHEESGPLPEAVEAELARRATARVAEVDAVVVSDYRKGVITEGVARAVIQAAVASGKPVVVDPKGLDYARYRGATVLTPNVHDAALTANLHVDSDEDLVRVAERLSAVCDGAALLVTRGAAGMSLFQDGGRFDVGTRARDVYDVTGAGDTVVAMLAVALGRGVALPEAVRLANAAAGVVVGKVGTSTVSLEEVQASLDEQPLR
jgi:D-beta-D-heptose 7-phosphate kinase/D-beta-D-heptose 1-phosphate adenosyltransferase